MVVGLPISDFSISGDGSSNNGWINPKGERNVINHSLHYSDFTFANGGGAKFNSSLRYISRLGEGMQTGAGALANTDAVLTATTGKGLVPRLKPYGKNWFVTTYYKTHSKIHTDPYRTLKQVRMDSTDIMNSSPTPDSAVIKPKNVTF